MGGFVGGRGQHPAAVVKPYRVSSSNTLCQRKEERKGTPTFPIPGHLEGNPTPFVPPFERQMSDLRRAVELLTAAAGGAGVALKCKVSSVVEIFISEALCVLSFRELGTEGKELGAETVVFDSYQVFNQLRGSLIIQMYGGGEKSQLTDPIRVSCHGLPISLEAALRFLLQPLHDVVTLFLLTFF